MVSAIILSYNRCAEVLYTIEKLKHLQKVLPFDLEIIVVDNGSADDTSMRVAEQYCDVLLITKSVNNGIAGWNDGFDAAGHPYLLVLDDDSHLVSGLEDAVTYMVENPEVGVLALNVTTGPYTNEMFKWENLEDVAGFIGCGALIKKELVEKIGGFAEWLHVYGHEWDFALRSINAGYAVRYFSESNVLHRASAVNRTTKRLKIYCTRNEMGIVYKHFGSKRWVYLTRMAVNGLKCIKSEGVMAAWYTLSGIVKFLQFRKSLPFTPVTRDAQDFYAEKFHSTQPILGNLKKRFSGSANTLRLW